MDLHYFTLLRQAEFLNSQLKDGVIVDSYTQRKNEQIVQVETFSGRLENVILSADSRYPFILLKPLRKRSRNSTEVLPELLHKKILDISMMQNERVMIWHFADSDLKFFVQLFRHRTNFFTVDSENRIVSSFKKHKKYAGQIYQLKENKRFSPLKISTGKFLEILITRENDILETVLRKEFLFLSNIMIGEITERFSSSLKKEINAFTKEELTQIYREIQNFLNSCQDEKPHVYLSDGFPYAFTLNRFEKYNQMEYQTFENTNDGLSYFLFTRQKQEQKFRKRKRIKDVLDKKKHQLNQIIQQLEHMPPEEDRRAYYQKLGELLLAQMHQVQAEHETIELMDYYDPEQRPISVRINPDISIQENAENYFKKAKEVSSRQKELKNRLKQLKTQQEELQNIEYKLENDPDFKETARIEKKLMEMHILQSDAEKMEEVYKPYKQFYFKNWEIWVGKNAKANDEMTFHAAHKEDYWLHAQGVGGSHVVVRNPNRKAQIPPDILNYAAKLAASYSQAKHSSYVPVMVTRIKYVRKPKKSPPGAVLPERTKSVFVEPFRS